MQEEHEEKALRLADMEAQKATNMIEHQDEIAARPARTWFQTPREKKRAAEAAKGGPEKTPKGKKGGQDKAALKGKRKRERDAEEQDSKSSRPHLREVSALAAPACVGPWC